MADELDFDFPRRCPICGYRLIDYAPDEVVCGACLDAYPEQARALGDPGPYADDSPLDLSRKFWTKVGLGL